MIDGGWPLRPSLTTVCALLLALTPVALAQEAEPGQESQADTPPGDDLGPSEDELEAIRAALEADTALIEAERPSPPPAPALAPASPAVGSRLASSGGLANPDIALILDTAGAWFSTPDNLQTGAHDPGRTGFNLQQLEMSLGASVDPFFRMDANIVFAQFGVEVEEAYATTLSFPANLQVRAGQFLTRFGRLNPTHPHSWSFADQPIISGKFFGGEGNRGLGAEISWLSPLPWYVELVASATDAAGACCARSYFGAEDLGVLTPLDMLTTVSLKQFFALSDDLSLMWGVTAQQGPNASGNGNRTEIYGTDLYLRYRPVASPKRDSLSLTVEAMVRRRQLPGLLLVDGGLYSQLVWKMNLRWETGCRYEWVTGTQDDPLDPLWTSHRQRASGQLTFYPSHFSRLRLQGNYDVPTWRDEPIIAGFLALEVLIGAHGAHTY